VLTVDIDVGGTLTDGIFTRGEAVVCVKVDTTAHDLTVCLFDCLSSGATQLGYEDLDSLLEEVELIRWSTTITSNVLAEQRGPRLGLILCRGHETDLYGETSPSPLLGRLVSSENVIGIEPDTSENEIMNAARSLLEGGVRRICVSLKGANREPNGEIHIKKIIEQQYPDHFLGAVPVLTGSDISRGADDVTRTYCALINAYTHGALAATLFKAEDELREEHRYYGSFLVSHINGGVSGIAKAKAIDTMESGPILGVHGSSHMAKMLGIPQVVALDVGGTTAKVSVLEDGDPIYKKPSDLFGIPLGISLPYLRSIALGGGSCVRPAPESGNHTVTLGPESMGSYPGPMCYGLGGDQATLTDAFVAGGLINPEYFLGGTKQIDLELARKAVQENVATPLGISVDDACRTIIHAAFQSVAETISHASNELSKNFADHTLFAYGGNGGLFACGVAEKCGLNQVYFFDYGPVFSAFGSSVADLSHVYERPLFLSRIDDGELDRVRRAIEEMKKEGNQDLLGEGIQPKGIAYAIELDVALSAERNVRTIACPESFLQSPHELLEHLADSLHISSHEEAQFSIELARLRLKKSMPKHAFPKRPERGSDANHARKGTRTVAWGSKNGEAQLYHWEALHPGNCVEGCAVLEGMNTTSFVPDGWMLEMDRFGNASVRKKMGEEPG
jgi:N-methylhydantoinase A